MLSTNGQSEALVIPWLSDPKGVDETQYPFTNVTSLSPSLHSITRIQQLLGNKYNYATKSKCEIFEIYHDGKSQPVGNWVRLGPCEVSAHFQKSSTPPENLRMRAIFCDLQTVPSAAFGFRLNITKQDTLHMLRALQVCPQFFPYLFGEPDCAPAGIRSREKSGKVYRAEDADALYRSIEVGSEVATHCVSARQELLEAQNGHVFAASNVGDALDYLVDSFDSQKRYIEGYKNSKDTAMNLVFHLLTQKDSLTSTEISRDMKEDSASMKTIAVLTMVFLPATAVSSFFGMAFFNLSETGQFVTSREIWIFAVISVPLTVLIWSLWVFWSHLSRKFKSEWF
ncbi:unnamed protein product [Clonostachys rosea]|uniref:Uncharacterized protein n=1 Tax=Bionectria ochroleuca TaxID=29856 RepID=A0ABY6UW55_BIOOC|nr:unnamed protein product [Clonostachys rosea]